MASSMQFSSGPTFTLLVVADAAGMPIGVARIVQEILQASGVNGRRWRTVHQQYPTFDMVSLSEAATFDAAKTLAESILAAARVQTVATLSIDVAGTIYVFRDIHLNVVDPVPRPGQVIGPGAGSSSLGHVLTRWNWESTKFPTSAT